MCVSVCVHMHAPAHLYLQLLRTLRQDVHKFRASLGNRPGTYFKKIKPISGSTIKH